MPQCAKCCAHALVEWWQDEWDLERYLCGHHSDELALEMVTNGWAVLEDHRAEVLAS
jgi:hypothetical protein